MQKNIRILDTECKIEKIRENRRVFACGNQVPSAACKRVFRAIAKGYL
jgi:hypothetical protein